MRRRFSENTRNPGLNAVAAYKRTMARRRSFRFAGATGLITLAAVFVSWAEYAQHKVEQDAAAKVAAQFKLANEAVGKMAALLNTQYSTISDDKNLVWKITIQPHQLSPHAPVILAEALFKRPNGETGEYAYGQSYQTGRTQVTFVLGDMINRQNPPKDFVSYIFSRQGSLQELDVMSNICAHKNAVACHTSDQVMGTNLQLDTWRDYYPPTSHTVTRNWAAGLRADILKVAHMPQPGG